MKKIFLVSVIGLIFISVVFIQQSLTNKEDKKVIFDLKDEVSQESKNVQTKPEIVENEEKNSEIDDPFNQDSKLSESSVEYIVKLQRYDEEIKNLIEDNYFKNITYPAILMCADYIKDEVESTEFKMDFYGGRNVNGINYDKKNNCFRMNKDCEKEVQDLEEKQIQETIDANRFNVVNGCLYDGTNKALNYNLLAYTHTDYFGQKIDIMGDFAQEWFRFEDNGNLYVFLQGGAGCGGCIFNGHYLVINLGSGMIEGKYSDLPYLPNLILSPNKKMALEATWDDDGNNIKLYLFNLMSNEREKLVYQIPDNTTIIVQGHGVILMKDAINWIDDTSIQIQLYEKDTDGYAKSEYIDNIGIQHFESGEPLIVKIDN